MNLKGSRFRIHQEERERIYNLKSILDHQEALASYAEKYQLGRGLVALQGQVDNSRINVSIELSLVNTRSDGIKHYGGRSREPQARTGRPGSPKRRLRQAPQPGGSPASPFQSHDRR